jgi:putative ABC transport system permease protein
MLTEIRHAFRRLRKAPGFTLTAVLTLALAIGGVISVFSIVESVLLRPLPFQNPDRLVRLHEGIVNDFEGDLPAPDIIQFARDNRTFSAVGGFDSAGYELTGAGEPFQARGERITAPLFPLLGVTPMLGRNFTQKEDDNAASVAILSYGLWSERFHSDPGVLGRTIDLDRQPYTIVGVMPRNFEFPLDPGRLSHRDLWVPMSFTSEEKQDETDNFHYGAIARLKPGVALAQAQSDLDRMVAIIQAQIPAQFGIRLTSRVALLKEETVKNARLLLRILLGAVIFVLCIACANLANLLLVRAAGRRREFGVCLALGAARRVMLRQLLTESLLLSALGGMVGVMIAAVAVRLGTVLLPSSLPRIGEISINWPALLFAFGLIVITGVLCGLSPAVASMRANVLDSLRDAGQSTSGSRSQHRLRSIFVVIESALALMLLVGAGLLVRSLAHMLETDPGFEPRHVLTASLSLPEHSYPTQPQVNNFYIELLRRLSALPQVRAVGASSNIPVLGINSDRSFVPEGYVPPKDKPGFLSISNYFVMGDYFRAMKIRPLRGRFFTPADDQPNAPLSAIISQSAAQRDWPGQDPVGKRLKMGGGESDNTRPWITIIGVVADIRQGPLDQAIYPQMYEPFSQFQRQYEARIQQMIGVRGSMHLVLNTAGDPSALTASLQKTVHQLDPLLALEDIQTMDEVVSSTEAPRRFNTVLLSSFAAVALLLSLLGIYGVLAYSVNERSREIAIRMALGATRKSVLRRVLHSAIMLAAVGIALGFVASLWLTRFLESLLYGVKPLDPAAFLGAVIVLLACALLAGWLPARRAASIDPMQTLRAE